MGKRIVKEKGKEIAIKVPIYVNNDRWYGRAIVPIDRAIELPTYIVHEKLFSQTIGGTTIAVVPSDRTDWRKKRAKK